MQNYFYNRLCIGGKLCDQMKMSNKYNNFAQAKSNLSNSLGVPHLSAGGGGALIQNTDMIQLN